MARSLVNAHNIRRRRSDLPDFVETEIDIEAVAQEIFERYAGEQNMVVEGAPYRRTFFDRAYCPDLRVMKLAGELAVRVNQHAVLERDRPDGLSPLRVTVREIMLAALMHDLGKHHEDCAPFIDLLRETDLRSDGSEEARQRKEYLLGIVRDVHCRKGPCMLDRLRDAGRPELNSPFIATVARRHGEDFLVNRCATQGCWWAREINIVTIADDYDAITSEGPERAYKPKNTTAAEAAELLRQGVARGRYDSRITEIFINDVLQLGAR
jgi:hypothetical protein